MVKLIGTLSQLRKVRVLVMGDFMLDTYTSGQVTRISPEAPVPILHVQKQHSLPGGAGNVVLNLVSLGAEVFAVGRVGNDRAGKELWQLLEKEGSYLDGLLFQEGYSTPIKNRVIAESQQIVRIDFEILEPISQSLEKTLIDRFKALISMVDVVAISDYAKGLLTPSLMNAVIEISKNFSVPIIIDPKGEDFAKYRYSTLIKPNLAEAYAAAKMPKTTPLSTIAEIILAETDVEMLLVTRSHEGMSLFHRNGGHFDFPVKTKEVIDVTGAGDTVLAMITHALANKIDLHQTIELSNFAAGLAIERLGCVRVTLRDLAERLLEHNVKNKIFDEDHLFALEHALQGREYIFLYLEQAQEMTTAFFHALKKLRKQFPQGKCILYLQDEKPDEDFLSLIASLSEVDFIILKSISFFQICERIRPTHVYSFEDKKLIKTDLESVSSNVIIDKFVV